LTAVRAFRTNASVVVVGGRQADDVLDQVEVDGPSDGGLPSSPLKTPSFVVESGYIMVYAAPFPEKVAVYVGSGQIGDAAAGESASYVISQEINEFEFHISPV
jgi:hypothetical protein